MSEPMTAMKQVFHERGSIEHLESLLLISEQFEGLVTPILKNSYQGRSSNANSNVGVQSETSEESRQPSIDRSSLPSQLDSSAPKNSSSQTISALPKEDNPKRPTASIWNRDGFTPLPQIMTGEESSEESTAQVNDSASMTPTPPALNAFEELTPKAAPVPTAQFTAVSFLQNQEDEELFVPLEQKLQRQHELDLVQEREEPDSSIPQSLDDLYEMSPPQPFVPLTPSPNTLNTNQNQGLPVLPLKLDSSLADPELHAIVAPAPLNSKKRNSWQLVILVSLICLSLGALLAYFFLPELALFIK